MRGAGIMCRGFPRIWNPWDIYRYRNSSGRLSFSLSLFPVRYGRAPRCAAAQCRLAANRVREICSRVCSAAAEENAIVAHDNTRTWAIKSYCAGDSLSLRLLRLIGDADTSDLVARTRHVLLWFYSEFVLLWMYWIWRVITSSGSRSMNLCRVL